MNKYSIKSTDDFISFIKAERYNQHLSQSKLGIKCGLKQQYISQIENKKCIPSFSTVIKIGKALGYEFNCSLLSM